MAKVITFSKFFPSYHPKKGQPTFFVEKFWKSINVPIPCSVHQDQLHDEMCNLLKGDFIPKYHTIRQGKRFRVGEIFSPRVWSGKPYYSKQVIIADDQEIKKIYDIKIEYGSVYINNRLYSAAPSINRSSFMWLSNNDGLSSEELYYWFRMNEGKKFEGQIICWTDKQLPYHEKTH